MGGSPRACPPHTQVSRSASRLPAAPTRERRAPHQCEISCGGRLHRLMLPLVGGAAKGGAMAPEVGQPATHTHTHTHTQAHKDTRRRTPGRGSVPTHLPNERGGMTRSGRWLDACVKTHANHTAICPRIRVSTKPTMKPMPPTLPLASTFVNSRFLDAQRALPLAQSFEEPCSFNQIENGSFVVCVVIGGNHCHSQAQPLPGVKLTWVNFFWFYSYLCNTIRSKPKESHSINFVRD